MKMVANRKMLSSNAILVIIELTCECIKPSFRKACRLHSFTKTWQMCDWNIWQFKTIRGVYFKSIEYFSSPYEVFPGPCSTSRDIVYNE